MISVITILLAAILVTVSRLSNRKRWSAVKSLRGPISPSWLYGFEWLLMNQDEGAETEYAWFKQFGDVFRGTDCFGEPVLWISDPTALEHILHTSGYRYYRAIDQQQSFLQLLGRCILWAEGDRHARHRKAMNPAFSWSQTKTYLPMFQHLSSTLTQAWSSELQGQEKILPVYQWLSKLTLDIIGESSFDTKFGSMEGKSHTFTHVLENLFNDSPQPSPSMVIYRALVRRFPAIFATYSAYFPTKEGKRFEEFRLTSKTLARKLLEGIAVDGKDQDRKDILGVLALNNEGEDPRRRMDEDEVLSQMAAILLAGHDTSAASLTWLMLELAKHPEDQERIASEIQHLREETGGRTLTPADYDDMPYLNAVIKEALRYHAISPTLYRNAGAEDVIPLLKPILNNSGELISQIAIPKHTKVALSLGRYNRMEEIWGSRPDEWDPSRHLQARRTDKTLGVYADLLTFSAGNKACMGWRFAILEMQTILFGLIESFTFRLPEGVDIQKAMAAIMLPIVRGKPNEGPQLPLLVKPRA